MKTSRQFVQLLCSVFVCVIASIGRAQTAPVITSITPPRQVVQSGGSLTLNATATNATSFQWKHNGLPIQGATNGNYTITNAALKDSGWYVVEVSATSSSSVVSVISPLIIVLMRPTTSTAVVAWGQNDYGQSNVPAGLSGVMALAAGGEHTAALKSDGTVVTWGTRANAPQMPVGLGGVFMTAVGHGHTVALKQDGTVVAWGDSSDNGMNVPLGLTGVAVIAAGGSHTVALKQDGAVVAWGSNGSGRSSVPSGLSGVAAVAAGFEHTVVLKQNGTVVAWGSNGFGQSTVPSGLSGVVAVAAGALHSVALKHDGTVVAWGSNGFGQSSVPSGLSGVVAVAAGGYHNVALKHDNTVVAWGAGQLVASREPHYGQSIVPAGLRGVVAIAAGIFHTAIVYDNSRDTAPSIIQGPSSGTVNLDDPIIFSLVATPTFPVVSFQWRKNGSNITGATSATFSIAKTTAADVGTYDVVVSNYLGAITSLPAALTVNAASPATIATQPANVTANIGQSVTLAFATNGSPTPAYQWFKNAVAIAGATNNSYILASAAATDAGTYTATATNTFAGAQYKLTTNAAVLTVTVPPRITTPPSALVVIRGSDAALAVSATGSPAPTYQWYKNGAAINGASNGTLTLTNVQSTDAGSYTVVVTNVAGSSTSNVAILGVTIPNPGRLINLSVLTDIATAGDDFTLGYVVGGSGSSGAKPLVIRAAGPSLGALGVPGTLDDPKLELFAGSAKTNENDNWGGSPQLTSALAAVGAFAYIGPASKDAATTASITTRDNSVRVSAVGSGTGKVIAEIYDATPSALFTTATPRLINVSVRKHLGSSLTIGFVVGGATPAKVLVRGIGPTLGAFGVPGTVVDPQLTLFNSSSVKIGENNDWAGTAEFTAAFANVGAFALPAASKDAALLVTLAPGNYTAQVTGVNGTTGVALVEVYEVP